MFEFVPVGVSFAAKSRAIAIPVDLDSQVNNLFVKSNNVVQKTILNWRLSTRNATRRDSTQTTSRDYRNIIERLQVRWYDTLRTLTITFAVIFIHFAWPML